MQNCIKKKMKSVYFSKGWRSYAGSAPINPSIVSNVAK